ncbi:MAG: MFS transporter [Candidatus Aerophobetes bacterium]|nr:MFS transporter [Candidatus Aerophobetes bacterium]
MHKSKRNRLIFLSLAHSVNDISYMTVPLLLPLIREEFHFTYTQAGLFFTCFFAAYSVFSISSGYIADKTYKSEKILSFGFFFTAATFPLLLLVHSYIQIIAVLILAAIGLSVFHPVAIALLSRGWQKGISFGFFQSVSVMGILVMTLSFSYLVALLGWRLTPLILTTPSIPVGLAFLASHLDLTDTDPTPRPKVNPVTLKSLSLFYLARGAHIFGTVVITSFMPLFAVDVAGLLPEKASFLLAFIWIGSVPAGLIWGMLSDYYSPLKILLFLSLAMIPTIFAVTLPLPLLAVFILLIGLGFCNGGTWPSQNVWLSRVTFEKSRGKIFGGMISLSSLARICSPFLFGFIADKWGLITTFRFTIFPMIIAFLCLSKLTRRDNAT